MNEVLWITQKVEYSYFQIVVFFWGVFTTSVLRGPDRPVFHLNLGNLHGEKNVDFFPRALKLERILVSKDSKYFTEEENRPPG